MNLKVKRLTKTARLPEKNNPTDAGLDIYTDEEVFIHTGETVAISTGISLAIPTGYYGRLVARSGLTLKTPIRVLEGTIDSGYRGEVRVMAELRELTRWADDYVVGTERTDSRTIAAGTKIAQLIIQPLPDISIVEADELDETDRGDNGFGSSGI